MSTAPLTTSFFYIRATRKDGSNHFIATVGLRKASDGMYKATIKLRDHKKTNINRVISRMHAEEMFKSASNTFEIAASELTSIQKFTDAIGITRWIKRHGGYNAKVSEGSMKGAIMALEPRKSNIKKIKENKAETVAA